MKDNFRIREEKDGFFYVEELVEIVTEEKVVTNEFLYKITDGYFGFIYKKNSLRNFTSM